MLRSSPPLVALTALLVSALALAPQGFGASDVTVSGAATSGGTFSGGDPEVFTATAATANALVTPIQTALQSNKTARVSTASAAASAGDLVVQSSITKSAPGAARLELHADNNLEFTTAFTATGTGSVALDLHSGGDMSVFRLSPATTTNGGNVTLDAGGTVALNGSLNTGAGALTLSGGTLLIADGLPGGPSLSVGGGLTTADGTGFHFSGTVTGATQIAGSLSPAGPARGRALNITGPLTLAATASTVINLGGTSAGTNYDRITASGAVILDGALEVTLIDNFHDTISGSTTFTIVQGASISGTFDGLANGSRVNLPGDLGSLRINYTATTVTLDDWQPVITDLVWDPGSAEAGTEVSSHTATRAGRHYYRVVTQATDIGAWRTRLTIASGDAALYLRTGSLPLSTSSTHSSTQVGSDGVMLRDDQYTVGSTWYILVHAAAPGAEWSLFSGRAYVHELGQLPYTDANSNNQYDIGETVAPQAAPAAPMPPEGMRFYQASLPVGTPAWSLWLQGSGREIALRTGKVPFHTSTSYYTRKQAGQMLVVPPVLGTGANTYFLSVVAPQGEVIGLDSRIQTVTDIAFSSTTAPVVVDAAPYRVFRVSVPVDQIAWDVAVTPLAGNPQVAVRKSDVPGEWDNHAFSEAPASALDSITLVPDYLSNGTWFVTVYGVGAYEFTLRSGHPTVTPLAYNDLKLNDQTTRAGWRYYSLTDIAAQNGSLGWELDLANQVPGTRIAIRRNKVPSLWTYRNGSATVQNSSNYYDYSGIGFLQRPGHQADVWYVGIYTPAQALGAFTLDSHPLTASPQGFDATTAAVAGLAPERWKFHHITVPAGTLGWDLRLTNITGPRPALVVRRDQLPASTSTSVGWPNGYYYPSHSDTWPSGFQWAAGYGSSADWTDWAYNGTGHPDYAPPRLLMGTGRPLEPGSYYVGVYNSDSSTATSYTLDSRGVGEAGSGLTYEVAATLAFNGGSATITDLAPREARYFKVTIPADTPSWEVTLTPSSGELLLAVRRSAIPDFTTDRAGDTLGETGSRQLEMRKTGAERYVLLPASNQTAIPAGDYYLAVVSEGQNPGTPSSTVGTGTASGTLTSLGTLPVTALGSASNAGLTHPVALLGGQIKAFTFEVPADTLSLEVRMDNIVGNPDLRIYPGTRIPAPPDGYAYGFDGGGGSYHTVDPIFTLANPTPGTWTAVIQASYTSSTTYPDASADLVFTALTPQPVGFDGDTRAVVNQPAGSWRYFTITVPEGTLGWDLRLTNITGPRPTLVVRRDQLSSATATSVGWPNGYYYPSHSTTWPTGFQWAAGYGSNADWTDWPYNGTGYPDYAPPRLLMGTGRPLEPGSYYVGVYNSDASTATSYTLDSRGVGEAGSGLTYEVAATLAFNGGSATITDLAPREARYFKVTIPADTPSWEVTLTPSSGELLLAVRRSAIPDFTTDRAGDTLGETGSRQLEMRKTGAERYVLLPASNQTAIPAGDYYLAVVSEGQNPGTPSSTVGTGTASGTLTSLGTLPVTALGSASNAGLTHPVALLGGQIKAFTFEVPADTLSLEVRMDNIVGNPDLRIYPGTRIPAPPDGYAYGFDGGGGSYHTVDPIFTLANPTPGTWTAVIQASYTSSTTYPDASADLVFTALTPQPVGFDGGTLAVANQPAGSWRYFTIIVPEGTLGWDLRLTNLGGPRPTLVVRRDQLPSSTATSVGWPNGYYYPAHSSTWPTGFQWVAGYGSGADWTDWPYNGAGYPDYALPRLVMATGRPLEPGTYFVGVYNPDSANASSYTLDSRGIGATGSALTYQVAPAIAFNGGSATITDLAPREARYFKVTIPADTPSWELTLGPSSGELLMAVRRGFIPDFTADRAGDTLSESSNRAVKMRKAGPERYVLLPASNQTAIPAGDYYIAVAAEGQNPGTPSSTIGTGNASGTLTSLGTLPVTALGSASNAGLTHPVALLGGQIKAFTFEVPVGTLALEVRMADIVGNPDLRIYPGTRIPTPPDVYSYGFDGGGSHHAVDPIFTLTNPTAGTWTAVVQAANTSSGSSYPDASANLVFTTPARLPLNYAASLNAGNGLSHTSTRQLLDGQKDFYEIAIPETLGETPVLGWLLNVDHLQGDTTLRINKTWGNTDGSGITITGNSALVVPPFLTPGSTWFVEVTGNGLTHYTLTSRPVTLERPVWTMPAGHNATFGDSGNDAAGNPLPGDRGTDIALDDWHFYAVDVPENNAGLLRTELTAINGNPNLYLREDGVPTTDHDSNGAISGGETLSPRSLTETASEYGNWVPLAGRTETKLRPGRWYLGVRASGASNARYRLIVSNGQVNELALADGAVAAQGLIGRDWRYYRVAIPEDAPANWTLTFAQQLGDVVMHLRDTVPPGNAESAAETYIRDWSDDDKNQPYPMDGHDAAGAYTFTTPVLRPGHTYYVGFRAKNDATFSLSSAVSGGTVGVPPVLAFYGGALDINVAASTSVLYRIPVPAEATRLKWTSTHPSTVQLRLEQGTLPIASGTAQHHYSTSANSSFNQPLTTTGWPWQPAHTYYLRIVNNAAAPASVTLALTGLNAATEDEDADGLPDAWELSYFPSIHSYNGGSDPDGDGVTNAVEFTDGTAPNDITSALYFLNLSASGGGSVVASPVLAKYPRGTVVTLTATPPAGSSTIGWGGTASSQDNPWTFTMLADHTLAPVFGIPLPEALDTTATSLVWTSGGSSVWRGQGLVTHDGADAAQSGSIGHGQETWIETTVTGPGTLNYQWKVSSQAGGDWLEFHLDGVLQSGRIGGEVDWAPRTHSIPTGVHTLRWRYVKNANTVAGSDAAWVDEVVWTATDPYLAWAGGFFNAGQLADPAISGPAADPDADGRPNLLEYALGTSPIAADATANGMLVHTGGGLWVYRYTRPAGVAGVTYVVETSPTLDPATAVWTARAQTVVSTVGGVETVEAPVPAPAPSLFARLTVSLTP